MPTSILSLHGRARAGLVSLLILALTGCVALRPRSVRADGAVDPVDGGMQPADAEVDAVVVGIRSTPSKKEWQRT